jgi:hypothetical protein
MPWTKTTSAMTVSGELQLIFNRADIRNGTFELPGSRSLELNTLPLTVFR